jgi:predicted lipoprotein with Yx(FWY)xxD motif
VNTSRTTRSLIAMLHVNVSKASVPRYPGPDTPLLVNGQMVAPSFHVLASPTRDLTLSVYTGPDGVPRLVDPFGMSLYTNLSNQPESCSADKDCPFRPLLRNGSGAIKVGDGVTASKIGVTPLADGTSQITYGGVPLYYNINDQNSGDMKGQGVDNRWYLAAP